MSSLFGNLGSSGQSQPAQTSSLFGNLNPPASNAGGTSNLFGNLNTSSSQAPGTGSLFGNLNTTSQPQTSATTRSSPFGSMGNTGSQPQQQTQTSSLFGNTTGQQSPSLFGSLGSPPPQQQSSGGSSLFGRVEVPASTAAQTSTLFSKTASQGPQTSTLFETTKASNATMSGSFDTSSLFPPQQPQQGQNQQSQPVSTGQGQGQQQDGQGARKVPQPGYFDTLLEKGRKRHRDADGGPGFQELPTLQLNLNDIAKRAQELGSVGSQGGRGADSSAHYLLAASGVNPGTTRRDLDTLTTRQPFGDPLQQKPDFEPDTHKYLNQIQQQSTLKMISEGLERAHRNFDLYLEESVDINWELQRKKIYEHFGLTPRGFDIADNFASPEGKGTFGKSSRRSRLAKSARNGESTMNRSIFGQSSVQQSVIGTPGKGSTNASLFVDVTEKNGVALEALDDRFMRQKQRKYADKVQELNQARLQKARSKDYRSQTSFLVLADFQSVENQPGGDSPRQLVDAYSALMQIVEEGKAKERHFAHDYLDETLDSKKSARIRKRIIDGSRSSLEKAFYDQLENLVAKNPKEAQLGGVPTTINKVKAYIKIRNARKDLVPDGYDLFQSNGDYVWPLIFFCLRCGLVKEAADYVTDNAVHFRTFDKNIITYLTNYASNPDRRLDRKMQPLCNNVYTSLSKADAIDPYRVACYKLIGRCDLSKRSLDNISQGVEDWIWLQFNLAREVNRAEESAGDVFGLEEVRETIREIGQRHFARGTEGLGGYGTFFHLQILGGMFEQAVSYLYSYSYVAAVHFAIALDYYGLLRVSDFAVSETELLTYNTKELPQISFGRMIGYYTRDFRSSNVEAAVDYLALICLNADLPGILGSSQSALCHEALRELVLETREFARLLGDLDPRGKRVDGAIEKRLAILSLPDQQAFLKTITVEAASVADDNGRTTDAVLLYQLAEDYDNVITVIIRALSEAVAVDIGQEQTPLQVLKPRTDQISPNRQDSSLSLLSVDDPMVLAKRVMQMYEKNTTQYLSKIKAVNRQTCGMLVRMMEAKGKVAAGEWAAAIDRINALGLLPLSAHGSIPTIRNAAQAFNALPPPISRNVGPLLLWTITSIGRHREVLANRQLGGAGGGTNAQISEDLLASARDLMVFAGLLKYRLGERVWEAVCGVSSDVGVV